jgi:hypothetical protein
MAGDWRTSSDLEDRAEELIRRTHREVAGLGIILNPPDAGLVAMARAVVREAYSRGTEAEQQYARAEREEAKLAESGT